MILLLAILLLLLLGSPPVSGGSLRDIEHVVIFMQENRSWDSVCSHLPENNQRNLTFDSTSELWLVLAASMIPMFRSTLMASRSGTSKSKRQISDHYSELTQLSGWLIRTCQPRLRLCSPGIWATMVVSGLMPSSALQLVTMATMPITPLSTRV